MQSEIIVRNVLSYFPYFLPVVLLAAVVIIASEDAIAYPQPTPGAEVSVPIGQILYS